VTYFFDPTKNAVNLRKHGASLADGDGVLSDPLALTVADEAAPEEARWVTIGVNYASRCAKLIRGNGGCMKKAYDFSRGRRGAVIPTAGKTRITIYLDDAIVRHFKTQSERTGRGYQTLLNEALAAYVGSGEKPLTAAAVRRILREEIKAARR
jgi:uncharacterized protein (DUF4415 family)